MDMAMADGWRATLARAWFAALFGAAVHLFAAPAVAGQKSLPLLGVDPMTEGTVVENHADALPHWVQRGYKGAVLLHIDAHDDMRSVESEKMTALNGLVDRGDLASLSRAGRGGKDALFNEGNFVSAAGALGIVRKVVWVVPFKYLREPGAVVWLRDYLGKAGFPARDIETFRPDKGCYRGLLGALPVTMCAQERLPKITEPVLVSLDVDFIPHAARYYEVTLLTEIRALTAALRAARYAVRDVVVSHSVQGGEVPVATRWVGEAVLELLRDPSIGLLQEPPERWIALQRLTLLKAAGRAREGELLDEALSLLKRQPHDPALLVFAAEAAAEHGGGQAALAYAEQACRVDRGYCVGLREVGLQLLERGAAEGAAHFFAAAERLQPGMSYGWLDEGILLVRAGRTTEAAATLEKLIAHEGAFPGAFFAGALHIAAGDRAAARRSYDMALEALSQAQYPTVMGDRLVAAIKEAAIFYRGEGLIEQAERLERDARLQPPPDGAVP